MGPLQLAFRLLQMAQHDVESSVQRGGVPDSLKGSGPTEPVSTPCLPSASFINFLNNASSVPSLPVPSQLPLLFIVPVPPEFYSADQSYLED